MRSWEAATAVVALLAALAVAWVLIWARMTSELPVDCLSIEIDGGCGA